MSGIAGALDRRRALLAILPAVGTAALLAPTAALAHSLSATYESRLPLAVYVFGAALAVGLSFVFVLVSDVRAEPPPPDEGRLPPAWLRVTLRAIGLIGWGWIVLQGILGGSGAGEVTTLFLWVYGWVGIALVSAFIGPAWHWIDPFATLFDLGAGVLRRLGVRGWDAADPPAWLGRWPAAIGLAFFVWVELVAQSTPQTLFLVVVGYTAFSLAMMAQFGRDTWRRTGETFSVWFGLLGRVAPWALVPGTDRVRRRPFASGLLDGGWATADLAIVGIGTGSILYDGLSQTNAWFDLVGRPGVGIETLVLAAFLAAIVAAALVVARLVGLAATGAGLLPIAVGYLLAHYFTYLLIDGQRIVVALADPFQQGWDLGGRGLAFFEPSADWLPPGLVWTIQLAAVVGGHMLGAWGGHVVAARELDDEAGGAAHASAGRRRSHRVRQIPLAVVMVALTSLTLWSLGQSLVVEVPPEGTGAVPAVIAGA